MDSSAGQHTWYVSFISFCCKPLTIHVSEGYGDCGSWVTSPDGQSLYGYITAGDPSTSIAYIIPASQAFSDIGLSMGGQITFPVLDALPKDLVIWSGFFRPWGVGLPNNFRRNRFPLDYDSEEVDETSEADGQSLWDEAIGLLKKAVSSRPTTPSDALSLDSDHKDGSFSDFPAISTETSSEEVLTLNAYFSRSNLDVGNAIRTRDPLSSICESGPPSFDAESSSQPGLIDHNALLPYRYNQQRTYPDGLHFGQRPWERTQHLFSNLVKTKSPSSPYTVNGWASSLSGFKVLSTVHYQ